MAFRLRRWTIGVQNSRHFFIQLEVKQKPIVATSHWFSRALPHLYRITSSFDWLKVTVFTSQAT